PCLSRCRYDFIFHFYALSLHDALPIWAFAESRLSWYAATGGFDFTTGASKFTPRTNSEGTGRTLRQPELVECLGCHTTGTSPDKDRKSTRLNSSHQIISYAAFCLKKTT